MTRIPRLIAILVLAVVIVACDSAENASVTPAASPGTTAVDPGLPSTTATATAPPSPEASQREAPYEVQIAHGDELDLSPAVAFVDPLGDGSTAWVFPETAIPSFQVSPDGRLIFWTAHVPLAGGERVELADVLFEELATYLEAGERDQVREDLDAIAVERPREDETWLPIATQLVEQLRDRLPPELAGGFKDRLSNIALGQPPEMRNHLLNTSDGNNQVVDWRPVAFGPGESGILALRDPREEVGAFILLDGDGEYVRDLPHDPDALPSVSAWSPEGNAVAITTQTVVDASDITLRLAIWPLSDDGPMEVMETAVGAHAAVSLAWSTDGERIALATADRIRVFDAAGALLWEQAGDFEGAHNLAWSQSGYLHLHASRMTEEGEVAPFGHVFDPAGEVHFRVRWLRTCTGDPWVFDGSGLRDGRFIVMLTGEVADLGDDRAGDLISPVDPERVNLRWSRDADGRWLLHRADENDVSMITVPPDGGVDRFTGERGPWTEDGRYLFSTPVLGRGGCAAGWTGTPEPPSVEYPPFED